MNDKPLKGITILDISRLLPGGFASLLLCELGARVIKIEQPAVGDYYRALTPDGMGLLPAHTRFIHAGKETLGLDLKTEKGRDIFLKLLTKAHVVIESYRPRVLKEMKLDFSQLKKRKPSIILCSITGFLGRLENLAGHDLNFLGLSGLLRQLRDREGNYILPDLQITDLIAGMEASLEINAALIPALLRKKGAHLKISMEEAGRSFSRFCDFSQKDLGLVTGGSVRYGIYETSDNGRMTLGALEQKFWEKFVNLLGHPEWKSAGMTHFESDAEQDIKKEVTAIIKGKPLSYWKQMGETEDICLFPVEENPDLKKYQKKIPRLGEKTRTILKSLGYSASMIRTLYEEKVVA